MPFWPKKWGRDPLGREYRTDRRYDWTSQLPEPGSLAFVDGELDDQVYDLTITYNPGAIDLVTNTNLVYGLADAYEIAIDIVLNPGSHVIYTLELSKIVELDFVENTSVIYGLGEAQAISIDYVDPGGNTVYPLTVTKEVELDLVPNLSIIYPFDQILNTTTPYYYDAISVNPGTLSFVSHWPLDHHPLDVHSTNHGTETGPIAEALPLVEVDAAGNGEAYYFDTTETIDVAGGPWDFIYQTWDFGLMMFSDWDGYLAPDTYIQLETGDIDIPNPGAFVSLEGTISIIGGIYLDNSNDQSVAVNGDIIGHRDRYHYCFIADGTDLVLYMNAVEVDRIAITLATDAGNYSQQLKIGGYNSSGTHTNFSGAFDELSILNSAPTPSEIFEAFSEGVEKVRQARTALWWYRFGDASTTVKNWADSGVSNDGGVNGTPTLQHIDAIDINEGSLESPYVATLTATEWVTATFDDALNDPISDHTAQIYYKYTGAAGGASLMYQNRSGGSGGYYRLRVQSDKVEWLIADDGLIEFTATHNQTGILSDGNWHLVVVRLDTSAQTADLWVDGVRTTVTGVTIGTVATTTGDFVIGEGGSFDFEGQMGSAIWWGSAKTDTEIEDWFDNIPIDYLINENTVYGMGLDYTISLDLANNVSEVYPYSLPGIDTVINLNSVTNTSTVYSLTVEKEINLGETPKSYPTVHNPTAEKEINPAQVTNSSTVYNLTVQVAQTDPWLEFIKTNFGPELIWGHDETSGTTAVDYTSNGNDGTYSGTYTLNQSGLLSEDTASVYFNGGYANIASVTGSISNSITIMGLNWPDGLSGTQYFWDLRSGSTVGSRNALLVFSGNIAFSDNVLNTLSRRADAIDQRESLLGVSISGTDGTVYENGLPYEDFAAGGSPSFSNPTFSTSATYSGSADLVGFDGMSTVIASNLSPASHYQTWLEGGGPRHYYKEVIVSDVGASSLGSQGVCEMHLPCWDQGGSQSIDVSMYTHHATNNGTDTSGPGGSTYLQDAIYLDNDEVSVTSWFDAADSNWTLGFYFKFDTFYSASNGMTLFDIRDGSGTLITISRSLGSISAQLNNGTKGIFLDPSPANDIWDGNWHHVGLTVNKSSDAVGLWVDGNLEADDQSSYNASWRSTAGSLNGHDMVFGRSSTGTSKSPGRYTGMSVFSTAYSSFNMNQLAAGV